MHRAVAFSALSAQQEGMKSSIHGRKNIDFAKYFCFYQKSCIFASLELAEPLNNA